MRKILKVFENLRRKLKLGRLLVAVVVYDNLICTA